jgi:hypothetical protein
MFRSRRMPRAGAVAATVTVVAAGALVSGCAGYQPPPVPAGSGGTSTAASPSPDASTTTSTSSTPVTTTTTTTTLSTPTYSWTDLPHGPDQLGGPGGAENAVYQQLEKLDCPAAQRQLDGQGHNGSDLSWRSMRSPSYVLILQASIAACRGDAEAARSWFLRDRTLLTLSGIENPDTPVTCFSYRALVSLLDQVPPGTVTCPGGARPPWPTDTTGKTIKADPRHDPYPPTATPTTQTATPSTASTGSSAPSAVAAPTRGPSSAGPAGDGSRQAEASDGSA